MSARMASIWIVAALCGASVLLSQAAPTVASELPDGRVYEQVSSLGYGAEVYPLEEPRHEFTWASTDLLFQAAADGSKIAFLGGPTSGGSEMSGHNGGNEYLGVRSPSGGWTESNISPDYAASAMFQAFSPELSVGFLDSVEPLSSAAPGFGEPDKEGGSYDVLYSTSTSGHEYLPFFTVTPPYRQPRYFDTAGSVKRPVTNPSLGRRDQFRILAFAGASSDLHHLLFLANDALTGPSEGRPAAEGGANALYEKEDNLYEWVDGSLRLVNVLPNGATHANATFGDGPTVGGSEAFGRIFGRVISNDGSRIFWTDLSTGHIYVRENGAATVEISAAGKYQTSSSDGSVAFYTNGDLYEYEVEGKQTIDLTPGVPVEEVVGASEDGKYVYYVTTGGEFKLWHDGVSTTIANAKVNTGEVTPDGHSVVFASGNRIGVYDADTGTLYCASCGSSGTAGVLPLSNRDNVYQPRWLSTDGSRVFFISNQALVPQDTNGVYDAYEWERPNAGSCAGSKSEGCLYLLSGGTSSDDSDFVDAGENGDDAFIVTRAKLTGSDEGELYNIYDVSNDGTRTPTPPTCTGTGCQGVPGEPPIFATPPSVTFEGVGNFSMSSEKVVRAKQKGKKKTKSRPKHKAKARKRARKALLAHKRSGSKGVRS